MAASEKRSSPRVAPRSVTVATAISAMIFSMVSASEFVERFPDEEPFSATVRFRTVGDMTCTGGVLSEARSLVDVVDEIAATNVTERGETRADDRVSEAAMEDRKRVGYF